MGKAIDDRSPRFNVDASTPASIVVRCCEVDLPNRWRQRKGEWRKVSERLDQCTVASLYAEDNKEVETPVLDDKVRVK